MTERTNRAWWDELYSWNAEPAIADLRAILLRGLRRALAGYRDVTEEDLDDFVQDSVIKVLDQLGSFRGQTHFTTWAQMLAARVALTELRHRQWQDISLQGMLAQFGRLDVTPGAPPSVAAYPSAGSDRPAMLARIGQMVAEELTDRQRLVMMSVCQGGMPLQEIAQRLGISRNAAYRLLFDACRRLQERMAAEGLDSGQAQNLLE